MPHGLMTGDLGGTFDVLRQLGVELTPTLSSIRVTVQGTGPERDAVLVARDPTLGFAYLQLVEPTAAATPAAPGGATAPAAAAPTWRHVDLAPGAAPAIGARLWAVARKTRGFDHVPLLLRLYASQRIEQPRLAYGIEGDYEAAGYAQSPGLLFSGGLEFVGGTPAFDAQGRAVGVLSTQASAATGDDGDQDRVPVLVPLDRVRRSLDAARARVPDALERARGR